MAYSPPKAWFYLKKRPAEKAEPPSPPPAGYAWVVDDNGYYVVDDSGYYLIVEVV